MALGLVLGILATFVATILVVVARGYTEADQFDFVDQSVLQMALWTGLLGVPLYATFRKGNGPVADFGLVQRWYDVPVGLLTGLGTQLLLVPALYFPIFWLIGEQDVGAPARELAERAEGSLSGEVLFVLVVVVGAPIVEEIFFRGLLLRSVEHRLGLTWAVVISSLVFGLFHFQLLQLPALVMFGVVAGVLVARTGRLGPAIWAHVAFNGLTVFFLLCDCLPEST